MKIHLPALGPDLPVHPRTGLTALGIRRNGAPIWPVRGASPDDPSNDDQVGGDADQDDEGDDDDEVDGDRQDDLRDAGKKALDAMKGQWKKARADLRPWSALARELGVKTPDEVKALLAGKSKPKDGDMPDPEQIRREARAEVERETARDRVLDKIEAKAGKFADPADAAALLLRETQVEDYLDGTRIDSEAIAEALADLLERKPYLAAAGTETRDRKGLKPDRSQGNRGSGDKKGGSVAAGAALYQQMHGKKTAT